MSGQPHPPFALRPAQREDVPALEALIERSVMALQAPFYSESIRRAALGDVFGVDRFLISDGTYYVAVIEGAIVGCGGWSRRRAICGANPGLGEADNPPLDPQVEPARVRAFFTDPSRARAGIGKAILLASERAAKAAGFARAELVATLAGEALYASQGYFVVERFDLTLKNGESMPVVKMGRRLT
jgi:GNAT superfamily N-acetyltransferase